MPLQFYWASGSCNSWRVHLALEIKEIPYQAHLLELSKREQKSAEYLAINPRGKVPAIRDGDYTLYESVAILLYLDRRYPEPPLFGGTAEEAGRILRQVLEMIFYFEPRIDRVAIPIYRGKVADQAEAIRAAAVEVHEELARLEAALAGSPFFGGEDPSAADCTAVPFLAHVMRAAGKESARPLELGLLPLEEKYPALATWFRRMESLPGYQRTFPPHWRP
jgi:glutathione S-transferase